jgi:hypothetical protein
MGPNDRPIELDMIDFTISSHSRLNGSPLEKIATLLPMLEGMDDDIFTLTEGYCSGQTITQCCCMLVSLAMHIELTIGQREHKDACLYDDAQRPTEISRLGIMLSSTPHIIL